MGWGKARDPGSSESPRLLDWEGPSGSQWVGHGHSG